MLKIIELVLSDSIELLYKKLIREETLIVVEGGWEWTKNPGTVYNAAIITHDRVIVPTKPIFSELLASGNVDHTVFTTRMLEDQFFMPFGFVPKRVKIVDGKETITDRDT